VKSPETRWLDRVRPDFVIISQGSSSDGIEWKEECCSRGVPYVVIIQAAGDTWWLSDALASRAASGYLNAVACFFVSRGNLDLTTTQLASRLPNASVIRNPFAVPYAVIPDWPQADQYQWACVARLDAADKGQDVLLDVLRSSKWQRRPLNVTFYGEGHQSRVLRQLKDIWNLTNVHFAGVVSPEKIWRTAHTLILPSRHEGTPLAVVEAMLSARCCIVTKVAASEFVEDDLTGFIASAPTTELLDEAMERAWQNRHRWQQMGETAARRVRELVSPDPVGEFFRVLKHLILDPNTDLQLTAQIATVR
jgi:glycosyltransferase involved in cell wall biosynthesis